MITPWVEVVLTGIIFGFANVIFTIIYKHGFRTSLKAAYNKVFERRFRT